MNNGRRSETGRSMNIWRKFLPAAVLIAAVGWSMAIAGCSKSAERGKLKVAAGLPPVAYLAKRVGGDAVEVRTMLLEGRSPHDYSPGVREIRDAASSRLFFTTGMYFEEKLGKPLHRGGTRIVDVSRGIERIPMEVSCDHHDHHDHDHHHHHDHDAEAGDPHVWLNVDNACRMAENIRDELVTTDPAHADLYRENCRKLIGDLRVCETKLKADMAPHRGRRFYVYHPAFGYYAKMLGLRQEAFELAGREVTAARLPEVLRRAREDNVRTVFTQPQFNPASVRVLEKEHGIKVVPADPLREDLIENFHALGRALKAGFESEAGEKK